MLDTKGAGDAGINNIQPSVEEPPVPEKDDLPF
jgi:hypothetical protein